MPIVVLPVLAARLAVIERSIEPFDAMELSGELDKLVGDSTNLTANERLGCVAEIVGLKFMPMRGADRGPWDSYFGPIWSGTTADGKPFYGPDAQAIPLEVIQYWGARASQTPHPMLQARYADLAMEIGRIWNREHPDAAIELSRELTQSSIDAHLKAVEAGLAAVDHRAWVSLNRAMDLALFIHDEKRVERGKLGTFAYCRDQRDTGESRFWWNIDNLAWDRKGLELTDGERDELIGWLDEALTVHSDISDEKRFDPHQAQEAADRLKRWYDKLGKPNLGIDAIKKAGAAFEAMAVKTNALTAIAWLEDLSRRYRQARLMDDVARIDATIKARSEEAEQSMKLQQVSFEIPQEEMSQWLEELTNGSLELALAKIAVNLITGEEELRKLVEDAAANAPIHAHISISIMGPGGFTRATIGSVKDDMPGRVMSLAATLIGAGAPWLHQAIEHTKSKWQLDADKLFGWLAKSPLFPAHVHGLLREGIDAWFVEDHVKAVHILVPQVEAALREMLSMMGESPMKPDKDSGGFEALGMGQILSADSFKTKVDQKFRHHLRALYTNPKGINLRNRLAHGLASPEILGRGMANWVIHSLLAVRTYAHLQK